MWGRLEVSKSSDLRGELRERMAALVRERAPLLAACDRAVLEALVLGGQPVGDVANLLGQPRRRLHRRIHRLLARITSPTFQYVAAHRDEWLPTRRRVAEACFLRGLSQRQASHELQLSLHVVRGHYFAVLAMTEASGDAA
jgi:DNA-directed RNA polymerase specialized sigma24 family protein